jgi:tetratricopeptide (TPR) repeat protein
LIYYPHTFRERFPVIPVAVLALVASACLCMAKTAAPLSASTQAPTARAAGAGLAETRAAMAQRIYLSTEVEFSRDHDLTKAWNGFVAANQADPSYAPAWFNLAVMLENQKQWKQAQDYFYRYLALAPKGPDAVRADEQTVLLNKYISGKMTPEDIKRADYDAAIQRARGLMSAGFNREAIADAGQAQALDSSRWEAYAVVSLCMLRQHKLGEAALMRDRAVEHAPADQREQVRAALSPEATGEAHK